jgi:hypothetical protein
MFLHGVRRAFQGGVVSHFVEDACARYVIGDLASTPSRFADRAAAEGIIASTREEGIVGPPTPRGKGRRRDEVIRMRGGTIATPQLSVQCRIVQRDADARLRDIAIALDATARALPAKCLKVAVVAINMADRMGNYAEHRLPPAVSACDLFATLQYRADGDAFEWITTPEQYADLLAIVLAEYDARF